MDNQYPYVFSLTNLTGRRASGDRRVIIQTFDVPWRGVVVASVAFFPGILLALMFWPLLGQVALFWVPIIEVAAFWLVEGRKRSGLHLRNYQSIIDRRRSHEGQFFMCGQRIDPATSLRGTVRLNTVAATPPDGAQRLDAVTGSLERTDFDGISLGQLGAGSSQPSQPTLALPAAGESGGQDPPPW